MRREDLYTVENNVLVLNREYLRGISEFRSILERNIPSKGDADGRKKLEHWKLFMYIKIVADLFSFPNQGGYTDREIHKAACKEAGLEATYKPDSDIKAAIEKYKEIQLTQLPVLGTISTVLRATKMSDTICKSIINNMEKQIEIYEVKVNDTENPANVADSMLLVEGLIKQLEQVNKIAISIPKTQDILEKLDERLKKESSGDTVGRGGRSIGSRADPV